VRFQFRWLWGYWQAPLHRSCDQLCNPVLVLAVPGICGLYVTKVKRRFSDGYWMTFGSSGNAVSVTSLRGDDDWEGVFADVDIRDDDLDEVMGGVDGHPRVWTDAEVAERAVRYERWSDYEDDFVIIEPDQAWSTYLGRVPR